MKTRIIMRVALNMELKIAKAQYNIAHHSSLKHPESQKFKDHADSYSREIARIESELRKYNL